MSDWAFGSPWWKELKLQEHELLVIHRQGGLDQDLMTALREVECVMSMQPDLLNHFLCLFAGQVCPLPRARALVIICE